MEQISHQKAYGIIKKHKYFSNASNCFISLKLGIASSFKYYEGKEKSFYGLAPYGIKKFLCYNKEKGWYIQ